MKQFIYPVLLGIAACTPIQQAPLMYTSKQVLGVDISAPTTESTGVTVNVGFKNIDAAYVPVAVSRENDARLTLIGGQYGEGDAANLVNSNQQDKADQVDQATRQAEAARAAASTSRTRLELAQRLNDAIDARHSGDASQLNQVVTQIRDNAPDLRLFSTKLSSLQKFTAPELDALGSDEQARQQDADAAEKKLQAAKEDYVDSLNIARRDALSVYGTFDSTTRTDKPGVVLGKVFSTGLAAQNLSEGAKRANAIALIDSCKSLAEQISDKTKKDDAILQCFHSALWK